MTNDYPVLFDHPGVLYDDPRVTYDGTRPSATPAGEVTVVATDAPDSGTVEIELVEVPE